MRWIVWTTWLFWWTERWSGVAVMQWSVVHLQWCISAQGPPMCQGPQEEKICVIQKCSTLLKIFQKCPKLADVWACISAIFFNCQVSKFCPWKLALQGPLGVPGTHFWDPPIICTVSPHAAAVCREWCNDVMAAIQQNWKNNSLISTEQQTQTKQRCCENWAH
jgi:hypothetical protein